MMKINTFPKIGNGQNKPVNHWRPLRLAMIATFVGIIAICNGQENRLKKLEERLRKLENRGGGSTSGLSLPKSSILKLSGDLRVRYENRTYDNGTTEDTRNRWRTRFRLGASFSSDQPWSIHTGLATGGSSGTSTNDTWNEGSTWETGDIRLDYAYAQWNFDTGTDVLVGQQKNPYVNSGIPWDSDLRPTGLTLSQAFGPGFATIGYYNMRVLGGAALDDMYAIQLGVKSKGDISYTGAVGYFAANGQYAQTSLGTTSTDYDYNLLTLYGDVAAKLGDGVSIAGFAEFGKSLGVDNMDTQLAGMAPAGYKSEDNDQFYTLGVKGKLSIVAVKAQYFHVEGDSVFGGLSNSDLGDLGIMTIDVEGYTVGAGVNLTKNATLGVSYWHDESIERSGQDSDMYRLDAVYKF